MIISSQMMVRCDFDVVVAAMAGTSVNVEIAFPQDPLEPDPLEVERALSAASRTASMRPQTLRAALILEAMARLVAPFLKDRWPAEVEIVPIFRFVLAGHGFHATREGIVQRIAWLVAQECKRRRPSAEARLGWISILGSSLEASRRILSSLIPDSFRCSPRTLRRVSKLLAERTITFAHLEAVRRRHARAHATLEGLQTVAVELRLHVGYRRDSSAGAASKQMMLDAKHAARRRGRSRRVAAKRERTSSSADDLVLVARIFEPLITLDRSSTVPKIVLQDSIADFVSPEIGTADDVGC